MRVGRARTPSIGIEALNLYALLRDADVQSGVLGDEEDLTAFVSYVRTGLAESLADQRRLHGRWAQDLFQAVVVSLDNIRVIKDEDAGTFYFDQAEPALKLPDFRVVRRDGEHLLVEVKNVGPPDIFHTQRLRVADVEAQRRYADLTGARLVFAHYWAGINIWTVVDSHVLRREGRYFKLDMSTAMMANELGLLGDRVVIRSARLVLSLFADPATPSTPIGVDAQTIPIDLAGEEEEGVRFTIGRVGFSCNGQPLADPVELRIARYLFFFGSGEATMRAELDGDGRPVRVDIISSAPAGAESPLVGSHLSSMYSARYILATKQPDGTITRIGHNPDPKLARLIPHDYWDTDDRVLSLSVGRQQPNTVALPPGEKDPAWPHTRPS